MRTNLAIIFLMVAFCTLNLACKKSSTTATTDSGSTGDSGGGDSGGGGTSGGGTTTTSALTASEIAGNHYLCVPITDNTYGTDLNGDSFYRYLTIGSDGTYSLNVYLFTGTSCLGGNEIFMYSQGGTYALGSLATGGQTEIIYTSTSSRITIYSGSSGGGSAFWSVLTSATCNSALNTAGFYTTVGSGSSQTESNSSIAGDSCTDSRLEFSFPSNGQFYDLISLDSTTSPSTFTVSVGNGAMFYMGQYSSYPTTATSAWTF